MRRALGFLGVLAGLSFAGAAHADHVCTAEAPDPAVSVSLFFGDDGKATSGPTCRPWSISSIRSTATTPPRGPKR